MEDDQGFIWFGTQYGLNRYDGYKFKLFKHEPGRPDSLSGVYVTFVVQGPRRQALGRKRSVTRPIRPEHRDIYSLSFRFRKIRKSRQWRRPHQPGSRGHVMAGNRKWPAQIRSRYQQDHLTIVMILTIPPA